MVVKRNWFALSRRRKEAAGRQSQLGSKHLARARPVAGGVPVVINSKG